MGIRFLRCCARLKNITDLLFWLVESETYLNFAEKRQRKKNPLKEGQKRQISGKTLEEENRRRNHVTKTKKRMRWLIYKGQETACYSWLKYCPVLRTKARLALRVILLDSNLQGTKSREVEPLSEAARKSFHFVRL